MSIMDELKKLTRPYDDDSALIDDDVDLDGGLDGTAYTRPAATAPTAAAAPQPQPTATPVEAPITMGGMSGVGAINNNSAMNIGIAQDVKKYRVILVKPEEFDNAATIASHYCKGETVILNLENTEKETARRVLDFLSGCAFALKGDISKAAKDVYIISPRDVGVETPEDEA